MTTVRGPAGTWRNRGGIPFRLVLLGPLVGITLLTAGIVALVTFVMGRNGVNSVVDTLRRDMAARIEDRLESFLVVPEEILQLNCAALSDGTVDQADQQALVRLFLNQVRSFDSVSSIYFGNTSGGLADAGREGARGSFYTIATDAFVRGELRKRSVGAGDLGTSIVHAFDARMRPWYNSAALRGGTVWSGPYVLATGQDMTLTASRALRSPGGQLLGVASVDVFLSHLGSFLHSFEIETGCQTFIIDRDGFLIAQSSAQASYLAASAGTPARRLPATESTLATVREAAAAARRTAGRLRAIESERLVQSNAGGTRQFIDVFPFEGESGLDWLVVTVIPASQYVGDLESGNKLTFAIVLGVLVVLVGLGLAAARQITRPISRLTATAQALSRIDWSPVPVDGGRIRETGELACAFNVMESRLKKAIEGLDSARGEVERRNRELGGFNQKLQAMVEGAKSLAVHENEADFGRELLAVASRIVGADGGSFYCLEKGSLQRVSSLDPGHAPPSIPLPLRECSLLETAMRAGRPVILERVRETGCIHAPSGWTGYRNDSALVFPISDEHLGCIGLVCLHDKRVPPFTQTDADLASVLSSLCLEAIKSIRAAAALREREAMYREVFEKTSDGLFVVDVTPDQRYRLVSMNPARERMLGVSSADAAGRFHEEFIPQNLLAGMRERNRLVIEAGRPMSFDWSADLPDGRSFFHTTLVPIQDSTGRIHRLIGLARDMTETRRIEMALRQSEEKFSRAFHGNPDAAAITGIDDGVFLEVNERFTKMFGYSREEVIGRSGLPRDLDIWVDPDVRERLVTRLQDHGEAAGECVQLRRRNGEVLDALISWRVIEIDGHARLLSISRDITNQRKMEAALKDSEARFRLLAENSTDMISRHAPDGRYLYVSPACSHLLGYAPQQMVGRHAAELSHPDDAAVTAGTYAVALHGDPPGVARYRIRRNDGSYVWFETVSRAIRGPDGAVVEIQCASRDISERVAAQEREREQERQLFQAAKLSSLGTLVSGIAHEINNPNNFIRLNSQNVAAFWQDAREVLDARALGGPGFELQGIPYPVARGLVGDLLRGIDEGSRRIEKLIASLRDFARGDQGLLNESVQLNSVVRSAVLIVQNLVQKSTGAFSFKECSSLPPVQGNYHQLEQVVINLLTNACQALASRDEGISIETRWEETEGAVALSVTDEGVGIPAADIQRVVDPFFTTRMHSGTGLGLSVSQRIIQNHRGSMSFSSRLGTGTVVTVRLPASSARQALGHEAPKGRS